MTDKINLKPFVERLKDLDQRVTYASDDGELINAYRTIAYEMVDELDELERVTGLAGRVLSKVFEELLLEVRRNGKRKEG